MAKAAHWEASLRMVRDWEKRGLIESPPRGKGLGRGRGQLKKTWSDDQLILWLTLLMARDKVGRQNVVQLCNLPVSLWLLGQTATVELPQVKRAMKTWVSAFQKPSRANARRWARSLVTLVGLPGVSAEARSLAVESITDLLYGGPYEPTSLSGCLRTVVGTGPSGRVRGAERVPLTAQRLAAVLGVMREDPSALAAMDDDAYAIARQDYHKVQSFYFERWAELAMNQDIGGLITEPTDESIAGHACLNLLMHLGRQRLKGSRSVIR